MRKKSLKKQEKFCQDIDPRPFLAYNRGMIKKPQTKGGWVRLILQILLSIACVLMLAFIFSNSLKSAEQSIEQSSHAVEIVQDFVAVFDPDSPIVTATGEAYDLLHEIVRTIAHFAEFIFYFL